MKKLQQIIFKKVIYLFIRIWFSPHREPYNRFRYTYVSWEHPEILKVSLNFDTYEIWWEKLPLVLKIVVKTENAVVRVAHLLGLKESELHWIEPKDIYHKLDPKNNI